MKIKQIFSKRGYLAVTLKNLVFFILIGPIHELVHAVTALILGGQVNRITFIPDHAGNLITAVVVDGYFKQALVALSPGIILGILGFFVVKIAFKNLRIELQKASKINPKVYSNTFKLAIGLIALIPLAYGLTNFVGAVIDSPFLYSGDYTIAAYAVENGLKEGHESIYSFYTYFPETTRILLVALLTFIAAAGLFKSIDLSYKAVRVTVPYLNKIRVH